jgi:hypothetical protein
LKEERRRLKDVKIAFSRYKTREGGERKKERLLLFK